MARKELILRYFLHLAYQGTLYRGWQRQPNATSIQATLEDCLSKMLRRRIVCMGCGRTDAGVHAAQYFAHINYEGPLDFDPVFRMNQMLPDDIVIFDFIPISPFTHAQYDAQQRTYDYFIHTRRHPYLSQLSTYYPLNFSAFDRMRAASQLIASTRDFKYFCRRPETYEHTRCAITEASLSRNAPGDQLRFRISADRFLRGMVRMLVAALVELGQERLTETDFQAALSGQYPLAFAKAAYPQGLHLSAVSYPYLEIRPARMGPDLLADINFDH